jgi:hypothetical protein
MVLHVRRRVPALRRARHDTLRERKLTTLIEKKGEEFVVLWSPETAEHDPDYRELGRFAFAREGAGIPVR